jgi:hypothetical protein
MLVYIMATSYYVPGPFIVMNTPKTFGSTGTRDSYFHQAPALAYSPQPEAPIRPGFGGVGSYSGGGQSDPSFATEPQKTPGGSVRGGLVMNTPNTLGSTGIQHSLHQAPALAYPSQPAAPIRPALGGVGSRGNSGGWGSDFSFATDPQTTAGGSFAQEPKPFASNGIPPPVKPPPRSRYMAMVLAVDDIPVGGSSILIRAFALNWFLVVFPYRTYNIFHMDSVGGLHTASRDFHKLAGRDTTGARYRCSETCGRRLSTCGIVSHMAEQEISNG